MAMFSGCPCTIYFTPADCIYFWPLKRIKQYASHTNVVIKTWKINNGDDNKLVFFQYLAMSDEF